MFPGDITIAYTSQPTVNWSRSRLRKCAQNATSLLFDLWRHHAWRSIIEWRHATTQKRDVMRPPKNVTSCMHGDHHEITGKVTTKKWRPEVLFTGQIHAQRGLFLFAKWQTGCWKYFSFDKDLKAYPLGKFQHSNFFWSNFSQRVWPTDQLYVLLLLWEKKNEKAIKLSNAEWPLIISW